MLFGVANEALKHDVDIRDKKRSFKLNSRKWKMLWSYC